MINKVLIINPIYTPTWEIILVRVFVVFAAIMITQVWWTFIDFCQKKSKIACFSIEEINHNYKKQIFEVMENQSTLDWITNVVNNRNSSGYIDESYKTTVKMTFGHEIDAQSNSNSQKESQDFE